MSRPRKTSCLRKSLLLFVLAGVALFACSSCMENIAYVVTGTVTNVTDGNLFELVTEVGNKLQVRLYGIDAPEGTGVKRPGRAQPAAYYRPGPTTHQALEEKIHGRAVSVGVIRMEKRNCLLGIVWWGDKNINLEMLREGYVDILDRELKPPHRAKFIAARDEAKAAGRGIWSPRERKHLVRFNDFPATASGRRQY